MSTGLQVWGPDGAIWLDTSNGDLATRVMGVLSFTPASHGKPPSDTVQAGSGYWIHTWTVPSGSKAWAFGVASGGANFSMRSFSQSGTTATMVYTADGMPPSSTWPSGTQIAVYFGYA